MRVAVNRENKMNVSSLVRDGVSLMPFATCIIVKIKCFLIVISHQISRCQLHRVFEPTFS